MSMPGLKLNIFRMVGKVLILIAVILLLIANFVDIGDELVSINVLSIIGVGLLMGQFYIEKDFMDKFRKFIILILLIATLGVIIILIGVNAGEKYILPFSMIFTTPFAGVFCQQSALSIYKKEKKVFIITFAIMLLGLMSWMTIDEHEVPVLPTIALIFVLVGFGLIMVIETLLKKKKLLNYI
jgi:uncharacterized membrane protein